MDDQSLRPTTRLAPSPTGALHLGNARTFLINWALARQNGWRVLMRMEDLDGPRLKRDADQKAIEDLTWLGMDWDGPVEWQSSDVVPYQQALADLQRTGVAYPCTCTRSDIKRAQSAPHADEHELRYPGTCRPAGIACRAAVANEHHGAVEDVTVTDRTSLGRVTSTNAPAECLRFVVPDEAVSFHDEFCGPQRFNPQRQVGDFVIATKAGLPAYQLAVVVDDARQGVTDIVRGDDLISSAARQLLLYPALRLAPVPRYWHLPLVLGPDGHRLAKRHGDTRVRHYRHGGVPPQRVVGLIASWCGLSNRIGPMDARQFLEHFELSALPREPVTFTAENHAWLVGS